jgi:vacuolar-type H+-ATPase subunit F/Vma7
VTRCVFLGDEVSAAGFRLAGVEVHVARPETAPGLFRRLGSEADLILLTAGAAAWVPEEALRRAIVRERPLILVIPDVRGHHTPPDLSAALRRQLGMAQ